jgi:alkanesulfonate monooxygenase SsuD/methylene tetrahydromethanopterin reductase-like flavin-dependent oxidoreductase (luciferase family)
LKIKFGYNLSWSSYEKLYSISHNAEKNGFDSVWFHDHLVIPGPAPVLESFSVLSALSIQIKKCRIGLTVADTVRRHPATLAHILLTINHISRGRSFLGIGVGESMNLSPLGLTLDKPLTRLKESIQFIKGLLNANKKNPFNFNGKIFSAKNLFINIENFSNSIPPVYIGASGIKTRKITGEFADGWIPYVHSLSNYEKLFSDIKFGIKKSNRNISNFDVVANIPILMTNNYNDEQKNSIKRSLAIRLLLEQNTLKDLGWDEEIPNEISQSNMVVDSSISKKLEEEADKIPLEILEQIAIIGNTSHIVETLEKYKKIGATHFLIKLMGNPIVDDFKKFNKDVIQVLKN